MQILNGYKVIFISLISTCINEVFVEDVYQEFEKIVKISLDQEFHVTISSKESYLKVCVLFLKEITGISQCTKTF